MKAAVLSAPGVVEVKDVPEPECPSGGALVRTVACAVCPSDIKMARAGHRDLTYPRILGHEVVGRVVASRSPNVDVGDLVQIWPGIACGTCPSCRTGRDNLCDRQGIIGFNADGGFAELMAVPAGTVGRAGVNVLPEGADAAMATLAEPLGCCVHGQQAVRLGPGDRVAVHGGGPMGLMHIALAVAAGASVLVAEPIEARRELAMTMGAERAVDPLAEDVEAAIMDWSDGRGADVALLATPQVKVSDDLLRGMASGGRLCLFSGLPRGGSEVRCDINLVHYRELTIVGAYGCTSGSNARAVELLSGGKVDLSPLITRRMALGAVEQAFKMIEDREALKCVITEF